MKLIRLPELPNLPFTRDNHFYATDEGLVPTRPTKPRNIVVITDMTPTGLCPVCNGPTYHDNYFCSEDCQDEFLLFATMQ